MINIDFEIERSKLIDEIEEQYRAKYIDGNYFTSEAFKGVMPNLIIFLMYHYHLPFNEVIILPFTLIQKMVKFANGEKLVNEYEYDMKILEFEKIKRKKKTTGFDKYLITRDKKWQRKKM